MPTDYNYEWSELIPIPASPEANTPNEQLMNLVEALKFQDEEIMAYYADLERVLDESQDEIDAFMELVGEQEEERQDTCTRIFALLAECRDAARPATPEERQAVAESTAAFRESLDVLDQRVKAQFAEMRQAEP